MSEFDEMSPRERRRAQKQEKRRTAKKIFLGLAITFSFMTLVTYFGPSGMTGWASAGKEFAIALWLCLSVVFWILTFK